MEQQTDDDLPRWCWSCRFMVAILSCMSLISMHALETIVSTSPYCTTNSSQLISLNISTICNVSTTEATVFDGGASGSSVADASTWNGEAAGRLVLGSFVWGSLLSILPAGLLSGWVGGRKLLGYCHMLMYVAALLMPLAMRYMHSYTVTGLKFIIGLMAGVTYPSLMALWQKWAPPGERTRLLAITFSGIPLGVVFASSTRQVLCFHMWLGGINVVLYGLGLLGIVWFILWMSLVSSRPDKNHRITGAESSMIKKSLANTDEMFHSGGFSWSALLRCQSFWSMTFVQLATEWGLYVLVFVMPIYLHHSVVHVDMFTFFNGYFSTAPFCALLFVTLSFAFFIDCIGRSSPHRSPAIKRFLSFIGAVTIAVSFVALCSFDCRHWIIVMVMLTMATGCHGLQYVTVMVMPLELSHRHAAIVSAVALTVARVAKFGASFIVSHVAGRGVPSEWHIIFYVTAAIVFSAGTGFALFGGSSILPLKESTHGMAAGADQSIEMVSLSATSGGGERRSSSVADFSGLKMTTAGDVATFRSSITTTGMTDNFAMDLYRQLDGGIGGVAQTLPRRVYAVGSLDENHAVSNSQPQPNFDCVVNRRYCVARSLDDVTDTFRRSIVSQHHTTTNSQMVSLV